MTDQLKKFINQHRAAFDTEEPGSLLYSRIKDKLYQREEKKTNWQPWRWAAVISGLLLLSTIFYFRENNKRVISSPDAVESSLSSAKEESSTDINFIGDASYARQINQFQEIIGLKQVELEQLKTSYPDLYNQFTKDIEELNKAYQDLKIKLEATPNREMLLEAMIQNLQLQSELLNRQLLIIKEIKQKTKSHAKTDA
jgi:hypothetical protein